MTRARVLQIGMDPEVIDFSPWPGQDADGLRSRLDAAYAGLRDAGVEITVCLLPDDVDAATARARESLAAGGFDLIGIGSGLRTSHEYTLIFERIINLVTALQPAVPLCFNDSPETTIEAVRRGLGR